MNSVTYNQLARYAAFVTGQLEALNADHRAHREYPGLRKSLPQDEIRWGRRAGDAWLADLRARYQDDLPPACVSGRGSAALTAQLLGDL